MKKENNPETEPEKAVGLGDLLKAEREKQGLSVEQLARITKLREHFIEALEKEEWEKLPARVFVKGFIRSYSLAIGYDSKEALRLFDKIAPHEEDRPKPLINTGKNTGKGRYFIISAIVLAAAAIGFFYEWGRDSVVVEPEISAVDMDEVNKLPETIQPEEQPVSQEEEITEAVENDPLNGEKDIPAAEEEDTAEETPQPEPEVTEAEEAPAEEVEQEIEVPRNPEAPSDRPVEQEPASGDIEEESRYTLKGIVRTDTYVKIYVDDNPPKEYIFNPDRTPRPTWKGNMGFYVIIGNAAGMEFDFNGKNFTDLGKEGKVKRLRLPEDFKSRWEDESE